MLRRTTSDDSRASSICADEALTKPITVAGSSGLKFNAVVISLLVRVTAPLRPLKLSTAVLELSASTDAGVGPTLSLMPKSCSDNAKVGLDAEVTVTPDTGGLADCRKTSSVATSESGIRSATSPGPSSPKD